MIMPRLHVQIDASAHLIASQVMRDDACQVNFSHLIQLEEYIEAIVLYDQVILPVRSGHEARIEKASPQLIWKAGILCPEIVYDMESRMLQARVKCNQLACSKNLSPCGSNIHSIEVLRLASLANEILGSTPGRDKQFREHIPMALQLPGTTEILDKEFSGTEYSGLSDADKIAIWYLLRTFCFVPIAVEHRRPYKHNYYRMAFAQEAYNVARRDLLQDPELEQYGPDYWNINAAIGARQSVPMFVSHILQHVDHRSQLEDAILSLRESASARHLREYHRELIAKYDEEQGHTVFDAKLGELYKAWRSIHSTVEMMVTIDLPIMPTRIPGELAWGARRLWYRLRNHPFRIYADMLDLAAKRMCLKNARKVFGKLLL